MNTRHIAIFGMAALGLALASPVQAAPDFMDGAFIVAKNDRGGEVRQEPRDSRKDDSSEGGKRRASKHETVREDPQGYGYGYERRQQQRIEENDRSRGRR